MLKPKCWSKMCLSAFHLEVARFSWGFQGRGKIDKKSIFFCQETLCPAQFFHLPTYYSIKCTFPQNGQTYSEENFFGALAIEISPVGIRSPHVTSFLPLRPVFPFSQPLPTTLSHYHTARNLSRVGSNDCLLYFSSAFLPLPSQHHTSSSPPHSLDKRRKGWLPELTFKADTPQQMHLRYQLVDVHFTFFTLWSSFKVDRGPSTQTDGQISAFLTAPLFWPTNPPRKSSPSSLQTPT